MKDMKMKSLDAGKENPFNKRLSLGSPLKGDRKQKSSVGFINTKYSFKPISKVYK